MTKKLHRGTAGSLSTIRRQFDEKIKFCIVSNQISSQITSSSELMLFLQDCTKTSAPPPNTSLRVASLTVYVRSAQKLKNTFSVRSKSLERGLSHLKSFRNIFYVRSKTEHVLCQVKTFKTHSKSTQNFNSKTFWRPHSGLQIFKLIFWVIFSTNRRTRLTRKH